MPTHLVVPMLLGLLEHGLDLLHLPLALIAGEVAHLAEVLLGGRVHLLQDAAVLRVQVVHQGEVATELA